MGRDLNSIWMPFLVIFRLSVDFWSMTLTRRSWCLFPVFIQSMFHPCDVPYSCCMLCHNPSEWYDIFEIEITVKPNGVNYYLEHSCSGPYTIWTKPEIVADILCETRRRSHNNRQFGLRAVWFTFGSLCSQQMFVNTLSVLPYHWTSSCNIPRLPSQIG